VAVAEGDPPDARHPRDGAVEAPDGAGAPVGVDAAAAEARDDEVAAVAAESGRRERDTRGLVQTALARDAREQAAVAVELVDVPAGRRVVSFTGAAYVRKTRPASARTSNGE
jgi:hypothetical protein